MKISPPLIAVDWGSTHFRAKLFVDGQIIASVSSPDGIRHREGRDCDAILAPVSYTHLTLPPNREGSNLDGAGSE